MEKRRHRILDFAASLLGIFDVDWDSGFASDGYTDLWGRDPVDEPLWLDEMLQEPADNLIHIPALAARDSVSGE